MNKFDVCTHFACFLMHFGLPSPAYSYIRLQERCVFRISQGLSCRWGETHRSFPGSMPQRVSLVPAWVPDTSEGAGVLGTWGVCGRGVWSH